MECRRGRGRRGLHLRRRGRGCRRLDEARRRGERELTIEQVELATLEYVWWWNNQRLHGELGMRTPLEVEAAYYAAQESPQPALAGQGNASERNPV